MHKLVFFPVLLVAGCVIAAAYGAVHNQISYTVSPEFFHLDLFNRCMTPIEFHNRAGASLVGVFTSWWMGLVIGLPVLLVALILPGWKAYVQHSLIAFGVAAVTALLIGLAALLVFSLVLTPATVGGFRFPPGVTDEVAFARAGMMHNFGYLGGGVGILLAVAYLIVVRVRMGRANRRTG